VVVSFGSILETENMPKNYFEKFMEAFGHFEHEKPTNCLSKFMQAIGRFEYKKTLFIWNFKFGPKEDEKHKVRVPTNVRLVDWMQLALLLSAFTCI
jgi:hypothetical protein